MVVEDIFSSFSNCSFDGSGLFHAAGYATSVSCERAFFVVKYATNNIRNSLLEQTTRASLRLKNWLETGIME